MASYHFWEYYQPTNLKGGPVKLLLAKLSGVGKHQHTFLTELFGVLIGRQGRATFEKLAAATDRPLSQTPAARTAGPTKPKRTYSRVSFYGEQLADCLPRLTAIRYWVGDGFYAKKEIVDLILSHKRHLITRLRTDADLYYLWDKGR